MRFRMRAKQASLLVGLFCCAFMIQSSTGNADDTEKKKPILAFFVDEKGHEFGGVIARTLAEEQVVWLGTAFSGQPVDMHLYRMSEDQFLDALTYEKGQEKNHEVIVPFKVKTNRLDEMSHFSRTVEDGLERTRVSLPISDPGIYYLEGTTGADRAETIIVVSNIVAQAKQAGPDLAIWTVDSRTGKHVSGGEVVGYSLEKKRDSFSRSGIDEDGVGRIDEKSRGDLAIVHALGETAFIPLNYAAHTPQPTSSGWWWGGGQFIPRKNGVQSYLYTDRSLYQPGDTVFFKAFAREDDDARYSPARGQARVKIYTGWGEEETVVLEKNYPLSGNGTFDGSAVLPKDLPAGNYYTLLVTYPEYGGNSEYGYGYSSNQSSVGFMVDNYRKPEFGLDVVVDHDRFIVGDTMKATLSGSLFSGEPLAGKQVSYTVTAGTYYDYGYYSPEYDDDGYRYGYGYGSPVHEGVAVLDANGQASIEVTAKSHDRFLPQVYRIEVSSTDSAENPVFESQNVLVMPADFSIYRTDYSYGTKQNQDASIPLILVPNRDDTTVAGKRLEASVKLRRWIREDRPNEKYPYYRQENRTLDPVSVVTDDEGKAVLKFTPPETGDYEFELRGTDDRGNTTTRSLWLWVADHEGYYFQGSESDRTPLLSIKTEKEQYRPDEEVRLTISSTLPDRDVWVTFERDGVHRTKVVELHGNTRTVALPLVETDMPNVFIAATVFSRTGIDTASTEIAVNTESKRIQLELKPDKERYLPGETVSFEVVGTDYKGRPADGEFGVWAIDKALFELMDQGPGDIFKTFWSKRYDNTQNAHSLQGILFTTDLAEKGGCFTGDTPVLMADGGEKLIRDIRPGEMIMTRTSESDATLVSARVGRVHTVKDDGYMVINDMLRVTAAHRMFVDGKWQAAGDIQIGSKLIDSVGNDVLVETITFQREDVTVYNLMVERYHTFFADGLWVHNNKDGGVRSVFKDTAYWNPKVRLGDDGKARVTFKLPDNTTTWVVSAIGANMATQVGQTRTEIMVSKNTIIRPALPEMMRIGDRVEAVATMSNNTDERINYGVRAKFDAGSIADGADRTITIEPHSSDRLTFLLLPEKLADAAHFTVVADAEGYGTAYDDGIESVFPVRRAGFLDRSAEIGMGATEFRLALPEDMERSASAVTLDLASSLLGTLPTAMVHLIGYPYGCVEQTTSRFVPIILARKERDLFADALIGKDTDAMLAQGVKNLTKLQNENGSWGFWHGRESNAYLTAYVVEYLLQARTLGVKTVEIDAMLERVRGYLDAEWQKRLSGQEGKSSGSEVSSPETQKFLRENATDLISITYARSLLGTKVAPNEWMKGSVVSDASLLDPNALALSVMTNIRAGELDWEKNGVNALVALAQRDAAGHVYWTAGAQAYYASQDASTGLAIRALTLARYDRGFISNAVRYIDANRKPGYWSNTFATVQVAAALIDHYRNADPETLKPAYTVLLDGEEFKRGTITSPRATISIPFDMQRVRSDSVVAIQTEGEIYSTLSKHIMRVADQFDSANRGLQVDRHYTNQSQPSSSTLALGDTVQVDIRVSGVKRSNDRLVIEDHLPAGMVAIRTQFKNEGMDNEPYWYQSDLSHIDEYTEDGVIVTEDSYDDSRSGYVRYLARVVSVGEFTVPPARAELMYAPEASGYSSSERIILSHEHDFSQLRDMAEGEEDALFVSTAKLYRVSQILVTIITLISFAVAGKVYLASRQSTK
ncbi:MAG: alpha-2-macroglobulin family protein [Candidatus Moraniibacteriota bacterium]